MAWVGKGLKDHLFPAPCQGQEHLLPDQAAQCQPELEKKIWGQTTTDKEKEYRAELLYFVRRLKASMAN